MIIKVLGSAAGGGFPQWNCNTRLSRLARKDNNHILPRTQSSIAVSAKGEKWIVLNASPDIRQQVWDTTQLHPKPNGAIRNSPIQAVVLTNGDIDHIAGLLSLRERQQFELFATSNILSVLKNNNIFNVLDENYVNRRQVELGRMYDILDVQIELFAVPGKVALYLESASYDEHSKKETGDTVGVKITSDDGKRAFYIPGCAEVIPDILDRVSGAECLLFDGTVFHDDELQQARVGQKTGRRMGHVPIAGQGGSLHAFDGADIKRKVYIHVNTTNPILEPGSEEETIVKAANWEVAYDGMTIGL